MPKVSVILPNYNHQKFLVDRIESILNQSFQDFELILLDDCSTDNSVNVLKGYQNHPKVSHFEVNKVNSGSTFLQWEKGLNIAKGEYIWIAESDDVADKDFLKKLLSVTENDSSIGLAFSNSKWINENGKVIQVPVYEKDEMLKNGTDLIKDEFLKGTFIYNASSAIFRKSLTDKVDFSEITHFKYVGDWMFWVQIVNNTKVYRSADRLNYFRRHEGNVSGQADRDGLQFTEGIKVVKYIFEKYKFTFFKKQYIWLYWTNQIVVSNLANGKNCIKLMPKVSKLYFILLKIKKTLFG